jgi:SRSO17 transposase
MQRLLNTAQWDPDQVRDDLQQYVLTHLADPEAILVVDETGFIKKGTKSAGVAPQYTGTVGKIANCQIGVVLAYANRAGAVLIDRELYLPKEWEQDGARCQEAEIPAERRVSIKKPTLAKAMLERAFAHGVQAVWVTGDTVYGGDYKLRSWLEERKPPYVLAVPKNQRVGLTHRADEVVEEWPAERWQRISAGEGSQGPRNSDWAWQSLDFRALERGWKQWLLARRSLSDPTKLAYYFVFASESVTLDVVVRAAGSRWQVEEGIELEKRAGGIGRVRGAALAGLVPPSHPGNVCAGGLFGGQNDRAKKGGLSEQAAVKLLPLTVPEVRGLLWKLVWHRPPDVEDILAWSGFRRRHQERARIGHIKRRAARLAV